MRHSHAIGVPSASIDGSSQNLARSLVSSWVHTSSLYSRTLKYLPSNLPSLRSNDHEPSPLSTGFHVIASLINGWGLTSVEPEYEAMPTKLPVCPFRTTWNIHIYYHCTITMPLTLSFRSSIFQRPKLSQVDENEIVFVWGSESLHKRIYVLLLFSGHVYSHFIQRGMPSMTHLFGVIELFGGIVNTVTLVDSLAELTANASIKREIDNFLLDKSMLTGSFARSHIHNESFTIQIVGHHRCNLVRSMGAQELAICL